MSLFTTENWNYSQYLGPQNRAIISIGAGLDAELIYFVTVIDPNDTQVFQKEFATLENACVYINQRYNKIWEFKDLTQATSGGGCGSCSAH